METTQTTKQLILKGWIGGRAGTRTPDLLRVNKILACEPIALFSMAYGSIR
jgi:hypothetical protein